MTHAGRLLVATPLIADPSFERTVVLLLAHGPMGAFGVVLNRPTETRIDEVLPEWEPFASAPGVVFSGGPVDRDSIIGLGCASELPPDAPGPVVGRCAPVDLHAGPLGGEVTWTDVRVFAGSAGWAPGQLEDEVSEGAWWTVPADPADVTGSDPSNLWAAVLRRQGGEVSWFANHPDDPSAN